MKTIKNPLSIKTTAFMCIDFETTGFELYKQIDTAFSAAISNQDGDVEILRFDLKDNTENFEKFKWFIYNKEIKKVAHNAKFELSVVKRLFGEVPEGEWHDTILMSQILQNLRNSHKLEVLCKNFFNDYAPKDVKRWAYYDKEVKLHLQKQKRIFGDEKRWVEEIIKVLIADGINPINATKVNYGLIPKNIMDGYQYSDVERGILLFEFLYPAIQEKDDLVKAYNIEIDMMHVASRMESHGLMLHKRNAEELRDSLELKVKEVIKEKNKLFGYDINLDSPRQLQKALFGDIYNFQPIEYTATGQPSASKKVLEKLIETYPDEPVFDTINKWRAFSKGLTNVKSYIEMAGEDLIIHPNINTNQAKTTRQSVSNPSLQNVSKEFSIHSKYSIPARKCFRPRPGYVYFLGDYASIELRLFIAEANETILIEKLKEDSLFDAHSFNANILYGKEFDNAEGQKRKDLRAKIKDAIFGIAYGSNIKTFAYSIGKNIPEAKICLDRYRKVCPNICNFNRDTMKEARSNGYVVNSFGRKINCERELAYKGSNYKIQSSAAIVLKLGEIAIDEYTSKHWGQDLLRQVLSVHDENMIEMHRSLLPYAKEILHDISFCMTNIPEISVPLEVEWNIATSCWGKKKAFEINKLEEFI